jgi:hypothetical protein
MINKIIFNALKLKKQYKSIRFLKIPTVQFDCYNESLSKLKFDNLEDYDRLFIYLFKGNLERANSVYTHANYEPYYSNNGKYSDAIEGVSRFLPYLSTYLLKQNKLSVKYFYIKNKIVRSLKNGTSRKSIYYWGDPIDYDQLICEMSDIALSIWLTRNHIWLELSKERKVDIISWLNKATKCKIPDNNWILFQFKIALIIKSLGYNTDYDFSSFKRIKSFQINKVMFQDGPCGDVDYYNFWGFNYSLYWISQIDPEFERLYIRDYLHYSGNFAKYIFDSKGRVPLFGRSIPYRIAAAVPLITLAGVSDNGYEKKLALYVISKSLRYYISNRSICFGRISSGYFVDQAKFVDTYSCGASSNWSIRPLIILNYISFDFNEESFDFSNVKLPVETRDYHFLDRKTKYSIHGEKKSGIVTILKPKFHEDIKVGTLPSFVKKVLFKNVVRKVIKREKIEENITSDNEFFL